MFERFTDRARRVVVLAQEEARTLNHDYIGTEHLLLGLIHEGSGVAAKALKALGITEEAVRQRVEESAPRGQQAPPLRIPFTPRAKKAFQLALREALQLGHIYIGTEHLLLGLLREGEGPGAQVLASLGVELDRVRQVVLELLHGYRGEAAFKAGRPGKAGRSPRKLLAQVTGRLDALEARLSALEHRVGTGPDLRDLDQEIAQLRQDKEAAIDAEDFERAAVLRDRGKELAAERTSRQEEWVTAHPDAPSLSEEIRRIRDLLREHGIGSQDGAA